MRLLNLFDGIGGFGLAAKWMGWDNVASCEIDPYCRRVLDYWFDYKYIYNDITTTDFTPLRGHIDLVTGGFPCQPFSLAGKQLGEKDDRYLWPHMLRAIREVRPRWVVAENVRGLLTQSDGVVFEQVCTGMEAEGYEVQPFAIPAAGVGAPHRRDRLWIVAHRADAGAESECEREEEIRGLVDVTDTKRFGGCEVHHDLQSEEPNGERTDGYGHERLDSDTACIGSTPCGTCGGLERVRRIDDAQQEERSDEAERDHGLSALQRYATDTDTDGDRCRDWSVQHEHRQECEASSDHCHDGKNGIADYASSSRRYESKFHDGEFEKPQEGERRPSEVEPRGTNRAWDAWRNFPTQSPVCRGDDGVSGRLVGITFPKWREQTIKMFGNSIVPQVAYQIYRAIDYYENRTH